MEITRNVSRWGNGAGILLPKEYLGNQVKIILIDRTLEIKKEVINILYPFLEEIAGIYLVGSYARGEERKDSDIDIIAISDNLKKEIISGKYHIFISPLKSIRKTLEGKYPELILPRLAEAKVLLNKGLLEDIKKNKIEKSSFKSFIEDTRRIIKINKEIIELDKLDGDFLESESVVYSIILRLRGLFLIKCLIKRKKYTNENFKKWLAPILREEEFETIYQKYLNIKEKEKDKIKIKIVDLERLINFLESEINL